MRDVNVCPKCGAKTTISYSKSRKGIRERVRECNMCTHKFSTVEIPIDKYREFQRLFLMNIKSPMKMG